ncbi:chemotaxis protein CheC [Clostridium luticellarii]|jgi:chemotaxis protein CheC|uniref:CheY-P phosphatase CheC n=1 Tax=Clostridium luticellarii TaxID=1691940 RepID=A0A2T0BMZ0_9CLOT|nr:chemotaxis protein CheC [Clostridium luticellarii]MCI1943972.1 chemotaxis protein CheC [Clostridium luticellarii]MCI1967386.1 chemotaxis protein CheC [Clostridium luticellarii]MCI1996111.1 chemotaxis protein CheC [Clostridium luticellarii]MCI2041260.1 chemotaxis protein CheC [Clostridium luticellarii]PRR85231.1 CheY-P phosphatase CheC [Clostridium luticellarii]
MDYKELTPIQLDALKEVGNIGTGNAATALSQLLNTKVDMTVPSINIVPFQDIFDSIGGDEIVVGVIVRILGDAPGNILFIFEKNTALDLVHMLLGQKKEYMDDMGNSVVCEVGNIIASSYMSSMAKFTGLYVIPSVPAVTCDMLGAILSTTFIESGQFDDYVIDIETLLMQDNTEVSGHFYYVPVPGSLEKILNALGIGNI